MSPNRAKTRDPRAPVERPKASAPRPARADDYPFFCFRHIDKSTKNDGYRFELTEAEAKEVLDFVCQMAGSSWTEIEQMTTGGKSGHHKHHDQSIDEIERGARLDLTRRKLDAIIGDDPLFRFRLGSTKRLWGFRKGQVFHAIWFDRDHSVYKVDKEKPKQARKARKRKRAK